ncbi:MAG TPA: ABC transporter ATP-binding protein, partial [Chlamydiales bacterium]|nr:ABC transporter ATP-binding protein [Chlamydiales bacterium]
EKQRVAIARALCNDPELIFADEPTGNLDEACSKEIHDLLFQEAKDKSLVIVTHDPDLASLCQKTLTLNHGLLK